VISIFLLIIISLSLSFYKGYYNRRRSGL